MTELLTATQMRAIEQAAIASGEVTGLELMERAGTGVVEAILEEWPDMALTSQKAVVLCGPGNNGGDGFVVARLLKGRGWDVEVFLYGEVEKLPPDAKVNAERWLKFGTVETLEADKVADSIDEKSSARLIVDALFGSGLNRGIESLNEIECILFVVARFGHTFNPPISVVSIDMPSGFCSDSGRYLRHKKNADPFDGINPDLIVTFHAGRTGHHLSQIAEIGTALRIVDIGLEIRKSKFWSETVRIVETGLSAVHKLEVNHKFSHGHALILSGPSAQTGAARLAARGALRVGAGLVTLGAPQSAIAECAAQLTAIMLSPIEDSVALTATLKDERINALCLGPALGKDERAKGLVEAALISGSKLVLDADALSEHLIGHLHKNVVLTPHAGEFKRMFPDIMEKLETPALTGPAYSKVDATREAAARAGCTVLFKGADTVIADETGRAAINSAHYERAAPWLATAGSGDVLAGFITGLLARGFAPMQAAETAAWLHVECALKFGPGLIAEDLPEQLPAVFKDLAL